MWIQRGTRNCTVGATIEGVQSSGSFEYIEFNGDMAAHTLWYISYNMYITHTARENYLFWRMMIFSCSVFLLQQLFPPSKKQNWEKACWSFCFCLRHYFFFTQTFRLAASKWLFFSFLFLSKRPLIPKMKNGKGMKKTNNEMFHENYFFSYRMATNNWMNYVRAIKKREGMIYRIIL